MHNSDRHKQVLAYRELNRARTKALRSPDALEYHGNYFSVSSIEAITFAVVPDNLVVSTLYTHPELFSMLTEYAAKSKYDAAPPLSILDRQGFYFSHQPIPSELQWILEQGEGALEEYRRKFKAGRAWKNVNLRNEGLTSLICFWGTRSEIENRLIDLVIEALELKGKLVVQFIDADKPTSYQSYHGEVKVNA